VVVLLLLLLVLMVVVVGGIFFARAQQPHAYCTRLLDMHSVLLAYLVLARFLSGTSLPFHEKTPQLCSTVTDSWQQAGSWHLTAADFIAHQHHHNPAG
jgi:hypothetical protein